MRLSEYASTQRTYGSRKVPRSVQQSIPIDRIYEDGTWRCGNVYSQMWSMPDINFTMSDEDNKAKILNLLGKVYMGVPSDCWLKICIVSQRMDEKSFRENVLLHRNLDGLDKWRVERNRRIRQCVQDAGNVVQHKYLILSTNKQNVTDARSRLRQVQGNLLAELSNLGCTIKPMANNERLEVLHNFFRRGEEGRFQFSFDDYGNLGNDFRNTIAPDAMRFTTQHAEIDDGFAKAMTIAQYPQQLSDNFVATLLQQVPYIVLSIDITPVETEDAMREIEASQMKIDSEKFRANRRNVENLDFMATISPRNQQQEKYTAEIRNAICEGDQQVFMVLLSVAFFADTPDELRQETDALQSAASNFNCRFTEMQVMTNRRKDATAATWIYFDEIHVLLKDPMSSNFLYSSWKRFRKYNAYATGISQDIQDYLDNPVAYALLSNSEFVIMLRQSKSLEALERLYGLSKPQLEFLRNASEGHGIIKMGNSMIPFSNLEPKDTAVYKLITTKPGEATAEK